MPDTHGYIEVLPDGRKVITDKGHKRLEEFVTNTSNAFFALTGLLSPATSGAAMARLSRSPDDMRIILLEEFIDQGVKDEELLERVITEFGDDSVQQLASVDLVSERVSNLLTKLLEWPRFGAYLEQSTRYIPFDQRGEDGHFNFYIPEELQGTAREHYIAEMDTIFATYSLLIAPMFDYVLSTTEPSDTSRKARTAWRTAARAAAFDAIRVMLPVAARSTVAIHIPAQSLENLIVTLRSHELREARDAGDALLAEARKVIPAFLQRADRPDRGNMSSVYRMNQRNDLAELAASLTSGPADDGEPVRLINYWPQNENDLLAGMLFEQSGLPIEEIARQVSEWPAVDQEGIWRAAINERFDRRDRPGRAFEMAHYEFTVLGDYGTFRDLQRHRVVDAMSWQKLTPYNGYAIPELVVAASFTEVFQEVFEHSERLYEWLCEKVSPTVAQYATLLGHRMRYRFIVNGRAAYHLIELRTGKAGHPGYRLICQQMYRLIEAVHPRLAHGMSYVNLDPPIGLGRLAAEERTLEKLAALDERQASGPT